jgi:hypothetical protein
MRALHLRLLDRKIRVSCADSSLEEAILEAARLLATHPFKKPDLTYTFRMRRPQDLFPDPGAQEETGFSEHGDFQIFSEGDRGWVVVDGRSTARFDWNAGEVEGLVDEEHMPDGWIVGHRLFFIPLLEWLRREGEYPLHGSAFLVGDRGVIVSGPGRSGKSTAALAAIAAGCPFLSDDTLFLKRRNDRILMNPYPETVKVGRETAGYFPEWRDRLVAGGHKLLLDEELLPKGRCRDVEPRLLLFPEITDARESSFLPIPPHQAVIHLLPQSVLMADGSTLEEHVDVLADLAGQTRAYLLRFGRDVRHLPERIAEL